MTQIIPTQLIHVGNRTLNLTYVLDIQWEFGDRPVAIVRYIPAQQSDYPSTVFEGEAAEELFIACQHLVAWGTSSLYQRKLDAEVTGHPTA